MFVDLKGRELSCECNLTTVRTLRKDHNFDVQKLGDGATIDRLLSDVDLFAGVLWCLVKESADKLGLTRDEFENALNGDVIEAATTDMIAAFISFFPPSRRAALNKMWGLIKEVDQAAVDKLMTQMAAATPEMILQANTTSSQPAKNTPESSE